MFAPMSPRLFLVSFGFSGLARLPLRYRYHDRSTHRLVVKNLLETKLDGEILSSIDHRKLTRLTLSVRHREVDRFSWNSNVHRVLGAEKDREVREIVDRVKIERGVRTETNGRRKEIAREEGKERGLGGRSVGKRTVTRRYS